MTEINILNDFVLLININFSSLLAIVKAHISISFVGADVIVRGMVGGRVGPMADLMG